MRLACLRLGEAVDIEPLIPMLYSHPWPAPLSYPDATKERFEANATLVHAPRLCYCPLMMPFDLGYLVGKFFKFLAICCTGES